MKPLRTCSVEISIFSHSYLNLSMLCDAHNVTIDEKLSGELTHYYARYSASQS